MIRSGRSCRAPLERQLSGLGVNRRELGFLLEQHARDVVGEIVRHRTIDDQDIGHSDDRNRAVDAAIGAGRNGQRKVQLAVVPPKRWKEVATRNESDA